MLNWKSVKSVKLMECSVREKTFIVGSSILLQYIVRYWTEECAKEHVKYIPEASVSKTSLR